ncbi:MAG TPA: response regulator [Geothrix sp.]|nr:response regulator [Geothrix sp.]
MKSTAPEILVVDDDRPTLILLRSLLKTAGYRCATTESGEEALRLVKEHPRRFHAMLLDRGLPGMEGLEVLRRIKDQSVFRALPVILITGTNTPEEVAKGLNAGAFYYLPKPVDAIALLAVVRTAVSDHNRYQELQDALHAAGRTFTLLESATFRYRTPAEAYSLIELLAAACPDPDSVVIGLAELAINAIEHGNLEIGYERKGHLMAESTLRGEIDRRLQDPVLGPRRVTVQVQRVANLLRITFIDEGKGFNWRTYEHLAPELMLENHGRGIFMAHASGFSRLEYLGRGNTVLVEIAVPEAQ